MTRFLRRDFATEPTIIRRRGEVLMRLVRPAMLFAASIALTACQTASGMRVNGIDIHPAQGGETYCERNTVMCLLGGAALAGGVAFAAMGHGYNHSSSGPGGMGMPGSGY